MFSLFNENSGRALTFAVVGRGKVGEFPQQPALLSIPAEKDEESARPEYNMNIILKE